MIFNLKSKARNFRINDHSIAKIYSCDAESLSEDHYNFIMKNDSSLLFQNGETRSDEFAHAGKYSVKLSESSPYGMTIRINNLKVGESIAIRVWRKTNSKAKGGIIAAANSPDLYYNNAYKILKANPDGWEKLSMEVYITDELASQELNVYLYNPNPEPEYYDDFEIIRYKSDIDF